MLGIPVLSALITGSFLWFSVAQKLWQNPFYMLGDLTYLDTTEVLVWSAIEDYEEAVSRHDPDVQSIWDDVAQQVSLANYHLIVTDEHGSIYDNLTEKEKRILATNKDLLEAETSIVTNEIDLVIFQERFETADEKCKCIAICTTPYRFVAGTIIFLTGFVLLIINSISICSHRYIANIMRSLSLLNVSFCRIESGDFETVVSYDKEDELQSMFCDLDKMRVQLLEFRNDKEFSEMRKNRQIRGLSHDLRTPLTSIKGYTEGLINGIVKTEEEKKHYYDVILKCSDHMESLIDKISFVTKSRENMNDDCFMNISIDDLLNGIKNKAEEHYDNIQLKIALSENSIGKMIYVDPVEMERVFQNIIDNSIKYSGRECPEINISVTVSNHIVSVTVKDNGCGVREHELKLIFEEFYCSDLSRSSGGHGLGLAICRQIIDEHHGVIYAENDNGLKLTIILQEADDGKSTDY